MARFAALALVACGGASPFARFDERTTPRPTQGWTYEIVATPHADELVVEAAFAAGTESELTVDSGGEPFVDDVAFFDGARWRAVARKGTSFFVPACAHGCRVRYRYGLRASARASVATASGDAIETLPATWLLRPLHAEIGTPFRFHVTTAKDESFASGVFRPNDSYAAVSGPRFELPYSVIGSFRAIDLAPIEVAFMPGRMDHDKDVVAWIEKSARAVSAYYGRFPIARLLVLVHPTTGNEVDEGRTLGNGGAAIDIDVGEHATAESLARDWVLIHEMIHTALPNLAPPHRWLEEGLATYVEPLVRVRAGMKTEDDLWRDWIHGMPNGLPEADDQGLDRTPTWGRTYWGGALFCLLADIAIREQTHGAKSIDDALRGIVAAGGNIGTAWTMDRIVDVGDAAIGVDALRVLYTKHATAAVAVDLDALWRRLGVAWNGHAITYDDAAPLAPIRRAMTARTQASP
ncbi:MAG TPA: hypothetical protein VH054_06730 [Polyangiaceae bacterium]|nr:hypothetical protein [Polyangiaceae bacterium]